MKGITPEKPNEEKNVQRLNKSRAIWINNTKFWWKFDQVQSSNQKFENENKI